MNKYNNMIEKNMKVSEEKSARAKIVVTGLIEDEEKITIPKLMGKPGLLGSFFLEVRKEIN